MTKSFDVRAPRRYLTALALVASLACVAFAQDGDLTNSAGVFVNTPSAKRKTSRAARPSVRRPPKSGRAGAGAATGTAPSSSGPAPSSSGPAVRREPTAETLVSKAEA